MFNLHLDRKHFVVPNGCCLGFLSPAWVSQEVRINLLINGVYWGYNPLTNLLLTSWDIQVAPPFFLKFALSLRDQLT